VAVLPSGLWDSLNSGTQDPDFDKKIKEVKGQSTNNVYADGHEGHSGQQHVPKTQPSNNNEQHGVKKGGIPDPTVDWTCLSCGNVNWSRRSTCNICSAAKPKAILTEDELRTGAGGGFNERQDRAAATTVEVADDGYDDFGRRAKEKKASDKKAKEVSLD
jgi:hypothetical protein